MNKTAKKYNRVSRFYDLFEWPVERLAFRRRRRALVERANGKILEIGVGTGKNLPYYALNIDLTAIDFSKGGPEAS